MRKDLRSPAYYDPALYPIPKGVPSSTSWMSPSPVQNVASPPPPTPFRFFELPTELRLKILRYLLPHNKAIEIGPRTLKPYYARTHRMPTSVIRLRLTELPSELHAASNILAVSKQFRAEASDVVYGENTFRFVISRDNLGAKSFQNPFIWVPDGILRRMWKCEVVISEVLERPEVYRRVRRWLERFAQRMGDEHMLRCLKVELTKGRLVPRGHAFNLQGRAVQKFRPSVMGDGQHGFQFVLEPLARLRAVRDVQILGHVDEGFKKIMVEIMGMEVGWDGLSPKKYPEKVVFRKKIHRIKKTYQVMSTKKFWEPEYEWGVVQEDEVMSSD